MARVAAADLDPHFGRRKIEFVVDDDEPPQSSFQYRSASPTLRPKSTMKSAAGEAHPRFADQPLGGEALPAGAKRAEAARPGDGVNSHEADVVAVTCVARARITKSAMVGMESRGSA